MIDLKSGWKRMLAEIGASPNVAGLLDDPADPRFLAGDEARLLVRGHSRRALFPLLELVLSARFARVPRLEWTCDLLSPLRKALGNAEKHGHRRDRSMTIEVEVVVTRRGVVLAVRDEGEGFDFALRVRQLRGGKRYFVGQGAGLLVFERARASIAFENGGRTVMLRFLAAREDPPRARDLAGFDLERGEGLGALLAPARRLDACRAYEGGPGPGRLRFLLRFDTATGTETRILAGRLHASEAEASADFDRAGALLARAETKDLHMAPPLALLRGEPRLVLSDFDPWLDVEEYLAERGGAQAALRVVERIGRGLRALHGSGVPAPEEPWEEAIARERARGERAIEALQTLDAGQARRARRLRDEIVRRLAALAPVARSPVHRRLGFDRVCYGVDGRFYLDGFESLCASHPGFDLGGFLADLLRVCEKNADHELARVASESLLSAYEAGQASSPTRDWQRELPLFVATALLGRLEHADEPGPEDASPLSLCERALRDATSTGRRPDRPGLDRP